MLNYLQKMHIFRRFLLSYILILVIPLIASFIVYQVSLNKIVDHATTSSTKLLKEMISAIDQKNIEIEQFIYQLHFNQDIRQLMHRKSASDTLVAYDIYKVRESLEQLVHTNTLLSRFYIYFNQIDTIITPRSAYVRPEDFFNNYTYDEMSFEEWNTNINQHFYSSMYIPAANVTMERGTNTVKESVITYVQSLPLNNSLSSKANVVLMINESEFTSLLSPISAQYNGFTYVYNQEGDILFSDDSTENTAIRKDSSGKPFVDVENGQFMYIELKSEHNDWTYVAAISKDKLLADVNHIKTISMITALISILAGLCIAFVFSFNNSIPLSRLLRIIPLSETKKIKNPYEFLHSNVEDMISKNTDLKNQIQQQQPILQDSVLRSVVMGERTSMRDAGVLLEQADIRLKGDIGYVGIIQVIHFSSELDKEMLDEINVARLMIQNEVKKKFHEYIYLFHYDVNQIIFLLTYSENDLIHDEKIEKELNLFINLLKDKYSLQVTIGMSQQFQGIRGISKAYEEVKSSLPFILSMDQQATLYRYTNKPVEQMNVYYYPIELEIRLINSVMNGEETEVIESFNKMHDENVVKRRLTQQNGSQLIGALHETMIRILSKNTGNNHIIMEDIQDRLERVMGKNSIFSKDFDQIKWMMIDIARRIQKQKLAGNQVLILKIKEYIKQNFHDPDLTLYQLSDAVGYPEKGIPIIFKNNIGVNISDYIEEIRMNYAKLKLTQSNDSIEDIAIASGYNSSHSFRRAFKRITGLSPTEYRTVIENS
ncbi:AraC family transcriptional regulator [Paenibacillus sp. LHD-38]|uniref:AraC family transcriptional regulator n=1 Tax=Paenibacillus sp. LHD-38 TaxID=3072143 RepID=UPI00280F6761|nr:AraC family transcriptional regulator [Paenibacillus sp. LHD-38]MDQ8734788.1 AraC family transcriptional regulator [Paenibacillus sp. LHD-38]